MTRLVPIRDIAPRGLVLPGDDRWVSELGWVPVSSTEFHLACRYYPIAVRFEGERPQLGLIVDQRYLSHALLDSAGAWRGSYRPVGLRCFPFEAPHLGDDPLSDIVIDAASDYLSATAGIALVDDSGRPTRLVTELHRLFALLKRSQETFAGILDQFLIGGLLVPLAEVDPSSEAATAPLYVIDHERLSQMRNTSLGAMARHGFLSVDVAVAAAFSLQNLKARYRPKATTESRRQAQALASVGPDLVGIDDLSLALDDGELVPLWNIDGLRTEAWTG
jgi:hypothetical protein